MSVTVTEDEWHTPRITHGCHGNGKKTITWRTADKSSCQFTSDWQCKCVGIGEAALQSETIFLCGCHHVWNSGSDGKILFPIEKQYFKESEQNCNTKYCQLRARRTLSLFKDVPFRTRRALSPYRLCTAIAPFWFSMEHLWIMIVPFWVSTEHLWIVIAPFWLSTNMWTYVENWHVGLCGKVLCIAWVKVLSHSALTHSLDLSCALSISIVKIWDNTAMLDLYLLFLL